MDISGENIVQELKAGNLKVFEHIFKSYYPLLYYEARGYTRENQLAEEIVCDVFTKIWQKRERLVINSSLREYLIRSVHNSWIDHYRHQKIQVQLESEIDDSHKSNFTLEDLGQSPLDYIITLELEERINKAIEELPPQYKKAFLLSRHNDMTYEEIANEMGISINSVKTNIKNALAKLRDQLSTIVLIITIFFR